MLQLLLLLFAAGMVAVIFTRWHLISEGRGIVYFDLIGGVTLTIVLTLVIYYAYVARSRHKELEASNKSLNDEVAARSTAEAALKKSEERFRGLVEVTSDWVWEVNEEGVYTYSSPKIIDLLGYYPCEVLGKTPFELMHPEEAKRVASLFEAIVSKREPFCCLENANLHKDGHLVVLETGGVPIFDKDGIFRGYRGIDRNITERKRLEKDLKASEEANRLLIEQLPSTTWIYKASLDDIASTIYVGPQIRVLGFSQEEWIKGGDYWMRQLHPDDRDRVLKEFKLFREGKRPFVCEYRLLTKDGRILWYRDEATVVRDEGGKPLFYQGVMSDITEHERLEQQLLQAQKMEAVGQLAAGIAHDFNNILTTVTGYAQFLMMKFKDDDPLRTFVEEIERAGEKGAELVKNILTFSRTEEFGPVVLDLNEVVRGTAGMLSTLIGEDIQLVEDLDDRKLMVLADKVQIEQVLVNLATNARDAMPDVGKLTITTKLTSSVPQLPVGVDSGCDLCALLTVSDTGSGMDEETSKRIFEPFFTTKEVGKGTGLGLSMVYGTIIRHNGCIDVVSEPGKGTSFNIYLPIVDENSHLVESLQVDSASRLPIYCSISRNKILIAEDEAFLRSFTVSLLTEYGYRCIEAVDGEDAVVKFMDNKETVKLLIADVVMPKKNGRDVYEEIRKIEPDMKVIYISGHPKGLLSSKGVEDSDGVVVLKKPFTPDMLLSRIREMIG